MVQAEERLAYSMSFLFTRNIDGRFLLFVGNRFEVSGGSKQGSSLRWNFNWNEKLGGIEVIFARLIDDAYILSLDCQIIP